MFQGESPKSRVAEILRELHHRVEAIERSRITQAAMAKRLGISARTYMDYLRGINSPIGMRVVLDLLRMLDDQAVAQVIQRWRVERSEDTNKSLRSLQEGSNADKENQ